jgi:DNA polymerase elongation subunit (family B)
LYKNASSIKSMGVVKRKKFYGFTNKEEFQFLRIVFYNQKAFKKVMYALRKPLRLPNGEYKFTMYEANIDPMLRFCHVQNVQTAGWVNVANPKQCNVKETYSNEEYTCEWTSIKPDSNPTVAPLVQASFDIETYSADGSFPDPNDDNCPVIQVATTLQRFGESEPYKRHLLSFGTCNKIEGVEVVECETETELLNRWTQLIQGECVDILIGYNIWGFDLWYMLVRAQMTSADEFFKLGKYKNYRCELHESSFSSSAYGHTDYKMVYTPGRFQLDLLVVMKREHKLTSYSLNNVAEHFLKDKKVDMPYKEMFKKYTQGPEERKEIGVYCVKDTDLPLALINKLAIVPNMIEMAKATWVPLSFLIERGQGIKVFSQLLYQTRQENMLVLSLVKTGNEEQEPYEGATVLTAKKGAYMEVPITGLDFASLYPTIMRAHNLCHSTLVMDSKYENVEGIEYKEVTIERKTYKFAQNEEGIFPKMLRTLAANRKAAKKEMAKAAEAGDYFMQRVYNGKQLAFKVSMNSMYGFCGANLGLLPCKPVASCTTSIGRGMIEHTKNKVEEWYPGADVVYGDSVTGDTPILLRKENKVFIDTIENIAPKEKKNFIRNKDGKETCELELNGVEVYTEKGWTKIMRVIRHKLAQDKDIFRINTGHGCVDVTSDHSMLLQNGKYIKPKDIKKDDELLHSYPRIKKVEEGIQPRLTRNKLQAAMSYLYYKSYNKNVHIDYYGKNVYYLHVNSPYLDNTTRTIKTSEIVTEQYKNDYVYDLTTENHHFQAGIGSLIVHNTDSVMVKFNVGDLRGDAAIKKSFELGEEAAERISATFKSPIELEFEKVYLPYLLFSKKRYAGLMYTKPDKPDYIDAKGIQLVRRDNCPFVKEVSKRALDSIMYNLDTEKAFHIAKESAKRLLNYEVPILDLVVSKSLKRIVYDYEAKEKTIVCGIQMPFHMSSAYANENQPHLTVAMKQEQREKGYGPKSGDRVPYIFLDTGNRKHLQFEKAEDPQYAIRHNLKVDVEYYLDHALRSPLESLFEVFLSDPKIIFEDARKEFMRRKNKQKNVFEFLKIVT